MHPTESPNQPNKKSLLCYPTLFHQKMPAMTVNFSNLLILLHPQGWPDVPHWSLLKIFKVALCGPLVLFFYSCSCFAFDGNPAASLKANPIAPQSKCPPYRAFADNK